MRVSRFIRSIISELVFIVFTLVLPFFAQAQPKDIYGSNVANGSSVFTYENLKALIGPNIKRIDDLIALLPQDLRQNFTLIYRSRSLHDADFVNPRALLFGEKSGLFLTFNGDSGQRGYNKLEIMQYRSDSKTFDFKEIEFPEAPNGAVKFHEKPASCTLCHGKNGKPIWDSYAIWPGVYGSNDDMISVGSNERNQFNLFLKNARTHPRYKELVINYSLAKQYRLADWQPPAGEMFQAHPYRGVLKDPDTYRMRPNLRLSMLLANLNGERVAKLLIDSPESKKYPSAFRFLSKCTKEDLSFKMLSEGFDQTVKHQLESKVIRNSFFEPEARFLGKDRFELQYKNQIAKLFRLSSLANIPLFDWTVGLEKNAYYVMTDNVTSLSYIHESLKKELNVKESCKDLKKSATAELQAAEFLGFTLGATAMNKNRPVDKLLATCIECHSHREIAPFIPFGNAELLKQSLKSGALLGDIKQRLSSQTWDRMPMNEFLSNQEIESLIDYFSSIEKSK
jgi:cytochrome c553